MMRGAAAGAAGALALDVASYADMVLRGRAPSTTPTEVVRRLAEKIGLSPLQRPDAQSDEPTRNRRSALGALSGYAIGISIGALYAVAQPVLGRAHPALRALIVGGAAMAASDVPATLLQITDPKTWSAGDWMSDALPHLAYGIVTSAVCDAMLES